MKPTRVDERFFVDSNVLLYIVEKHEVKAAKAIALLDQRPTISVQVLNEIVNVSRKKFKLDWQAVGTALELITDSCEVLPVNLGVHVKAVETAEANLLNIYDANLVAAAELSGCDILYSEDMNDGQRIGRVTIRNPFK